MPSYLDGLLVFLGPFAALVLAAAVGLPRAVANAFAVLGCLVLVLVGGLVAVGQALFVVPALLILFGTCSAGVLLCALLARLVQWLRSRAKRA
jgi:hypothetical protein